MLRWSERQRDLKLSELDDELLTFMADSIDEHLPPTCRHRIYRWFDVYDVEEKRIPV